MTTSSLILLGSVTVAFIAALMAVLYNRRQLQQLRVQQREPVISNSAGSKTDNTWKEDVDNYDCGVGEVRIVNPAAKSHQASTNNRSATPINDVIVISVMAEPDRPYMGYELLQSLLAAGMRYGKMKIFHRHEQANGQGPILFSLASATKPGVFELDKMNTVMCKGLTLFMQTSQVNEPATTFELMLETAKQLVDDLGGYLCDNQRMPLTEQGIKEMRDSVRAYERDCATVDMFE